MLGNKTKNKKRDYQESEFTTHDGENIFYRYWGALNGEAKGAIIIFHRGHEHSGRVFHIVDELGLDDYAFFAWDARAHGKTKKNSEYIHNIGDLVADIQCFVEYIINNYNIDIQKQYFIAQSVGAVLVSAWIHDYAPKIKGATLVSPAFDVKLYVPFAKLMLNLMYKIRGNFFVNSYVKAKYLTHDPVRIESYNNDFLITRPIAVNILLELFDVSNRVVNDANAIFSPIQLLISGKDFVVNKKAQYSFFNNLGSINKEKIEFDDFYHDLLGEKDREIAINKMRDFILLQFSINQEIPYLGDMDKSGYTYKELEYLSSNPKSLKKIYWSIMKFFIKLGSKLSMGMKIGEKVGFDSGSSLDYVYQNRAHGTFLIGKLIDRIYLNSIGWRGIRKRKENIKKLINYSLDLINQQKNEINILDIAAGQGRYILETIKETNIEVNSILLRDFSLINVENGKNLIYKMNLENIGKFEQGDSFNINQLSQIKPNPNIVVISGFYELFSSNDLIRNSLLGISKSVKEDGYLIYTNQPWHPQLEMIARTLTSHQDSKAWIMRRRIQAEIDQLVEEAGFEKVTQLVDKWGIFTVSLAKVKKINEY